MIFKEFKHTHPHLNIKLDEPLALYSYTRTGGPADAIVFPKSVEEVVEIVEWVDQEGLPLTILGSLSNLIVKDGGIEGVVMILSDMAHMEVKGHEVIADGGAALIEVTRLARDHSLTGLEFACGIPGSVGGGVFMNAGAYGGEIKDIPVVIEAIDRQGNLHTYTNEEADFSYRHSAFQDNGHIILRTTFQLTPGEYDEINEQMEHLTYLRESKQPLEYPSCGSVFKRPEGYFTGKLIQDAGLQGHRIGGAEISKKHAGFIINVGEATATDYVQMIHHIQEVIWKENEVELETEVRIIGRDK